MQTRLFLSIPPTCRFCDAAGTVTPTFAVDRTLAFVVWTCGQCRNDWTASVDEARGERRSSRTQGPPIPLSDRRLPRR